MSTRKKQDSPVKPPSGGEKKATLKYKGHVPVLYVDGAAFSNAVKQFGEPAEFVEVLEQFLADGLTVKFTPSVDCERVYCELGGTESSATDKRGYYLTAFGGSPSSAFSVAAYRSIVMYENDWPTDKDGIEYG